MRTSTFWGCVAVGGLMICTATDAAAKDSGFYIGADAGLANYPDDANLQLGTITLTTAASHDTDFTPRLIAGFRLSRYFALETGYVDLGEAKATMRDAAGGAATVADLRFKARGPMLNAIGSLPLGNWEPFIKLGLFWQNVHLNLDGSTGGTPFSFASKADGVKVFSGAGVGYTFSEQWRVQLEVDYFGKVGDENRTGKARVLTTAVGLAYRF